MGFGEYLQIGIRVNDEQRVEEKQHRSRLLLLENQTEHLEQPVLPGVRPVQKVRTVRRSKEVQSYHEGLSPDEGHSSVTLLSTPHVVPMASVEI